MGASDFETKDSGERAHFDSGMQRDTEDGKPRFDLMIPLDVPYEEQMITRLAALYGRGAVKYESRNWEQANSEEEMARMKSSAFRHFMQWLCGETDEDHAAAVMFNVVAFETTKFKMSASNALETPEDFDRAAEQILKVPSDKAVPTRDLSADLRPPLEGPQGPNEVGPNACIWSERWLNCEEGDCKKRNHSDTARRRG
jgi:hypothetical protein